MKQERRDAIGMMVFSVVWIGVSVILFLIHAHYRFDVFLDGILGKGTLSSLIKIPVSLIWILIYFGWFFGFFSAAKQFITRQKPPSDTQTQQGKTKDTQSAPVDADKLRR